MKIKSLSIFFFILFFIFFIYVLHRKEKESALLIIESIFVMYSLTYQVMPVNYAGHFIHGIKEKIGIENSLIEHI